MNISISISKRMAFFDISTHPFASNSTTSIHKSHLAKIIRIRCALSLFPHLFCHRTIHSRCLFRFLPFSAFVSCYMSYSLPPMTSSQHYHQIVHNTIHANVCLLCIQSNAIFIWFERIIKIVYRWYGWYMSLFERIVHISTLPISMVFVSYKIYRSAERTESIFENFDISSVFQKFTHTLCNV